MSYGTGRPSRRGAPRPLGSLLLLLALPPVVVGCGSPSPEGSDPRTPDARYRTPPQLDDGWRVASPEDVGLARAPLARLTEAVRRGEEYPNVHAVLIAKDGRLVYEEYFGGWDWRDRSWPLGPNVMVPITFHRDSLHDIRSAGKSIAAALVGIAVGSGAIPSVDQPLFDYFPEHAGLATPEKRQISLRHALTMSAGLDWNEGDVSMEAPSNHEKVMARSPDPARFVLARPLVAEPGSTFYYSGGLSTLLGFAVSRATGQSLGAFARERLFEPLEITTVEWGGPMAWNDVPELHWPSSEPWARVATPTGELWMQARDLLKFGQTYLDGGRWNGRRVVPEAWVRESIEPHVALGSQEHGQGVTSHRGYGYQWWHTRYRLPYGDLSVHFAAGNGGQVVWLVPQVGVAAVHLAGNYNMVFSSWRTQKLLLERVIPWALGIEATYRHEMGRPVRGVGPGEWPMVPLTPRERALYVGTYEERVVNARGPERIEVWEEAGVLRMRLRDGGVIDLIPAGDHVFAAGRVQEGRPTEIYWPDERIVFVVDEGRLLRYEWRQVGNEGTLITGTPVPPGGA